MRYPSALRALVTIAVSSGCGGSGGADDDTGDSGTAAPEIEVGEMGMRRLSVREYDNTLRDLLDDPSRPAASLLPEDLRTPFDNDFPSQLASIVLVESLEVLATEAAERLVADEARRDAVVGCTPSSTDDAVCMKDFIARFGRLALRRPLADVEVDELQALGAQYAMTEDDFYAGTEVVVAALLQDAEFVYRIEKGTPVPDEPGLFRLNAFELATRMSYFVWGTTPDGPLLDLAEAGELDDPDDIAAVTASMLGDPRARDQVDRFHAMWMGFEQLPHSAALTTAMRQETRALLDRVIFTDQTSWMDVFRARDSYINDELAAHYGLPSPGSATPVWVDTSSQGRQGLLGQGSFLSVGNNPTDTSPTKRGKLIRNRLLCQTVPPPPPDVNADAPPDTANAECKVDQYAAHRVGSCAGCHALMDPLGFGLENFDLAGRYRTHDEGRPQCVISGEGVLDTLGTFVGPAELSDLLLETGLLPHCAVEQAYRYAMGRAPAAMDDELIEAVTQAFADGDHRFDALIVGLVANDAFRFRREEATQ